LHSETSPVWVEQAAQHLDILLIDHAHCEKKAASTAMGLIYRYLDKYELLQKMSRLAREELRHFEQVLKLLKQRGLNYQRLKPSGYAKHLHQHVRTFEPGRLLDHLIIGAIIEARSCERFMALCPRLDEKLANFYRSLLACESRHFKDYLSLAERYAPDSIEERIQFFLQQESTYLQQKDQVLRFHSGVCEVMGEGVQ
jgi:tRNA-(ms[2]io[6]A)-hydroxylase